MGTFHPFHFCAPSVATLMTLEIGHLRPRGHQAVCRRIELVFARGLCYSLLPAFDNTASSHLSCTARSIQYLSCRVRLPYLETPSIQHPGVTERQTPSHLDLAFDITLVVRRVSVNASSHDIHNTGSVLLDRVTDLLGLLFDLFPSFGEDVAFVQELCSLCILPLLRCLVLGVRIDAAAEHLQNAELVFRRRVADFAEVLGSSAPLEDRFCNGPVLEASRHSAVMSLAGNDETVSVRLWDGDCASNSGEDQEGIEEVGEMHDGFWEMATLTGLRRGQKDR